MKLQVLVTVMLVICTGVASTEDFLKLFKKWKTFHKKLYKNAVEEERRIAVWVENWNQITKHNFEALLGKHTYLLAMNHFGDMNRTEFIQAMNGYRNSRRLKRSTTSQYFKHLSIKDEKLPKSVDWRDRGLVTPVKSQGQCKSCWAFSATGSLEGQIKRKTGRLVSLSEQNLMDCINTPEKDEKCYPGVVDHAFNYIKINDGIDSEKSYPYEAMAGACRYKEQNKSATIKSFIDIPCGDEDALKKAVATQGPVSVAIDASSRQFRFYSSGFYNQPDCSSKKLDHAVLVIGYGIIQGSNNDFWLVKNSWGPQWGDKGYIKMARNRNNQCGIATRASYPMV